MSAEGKKQREKLFSIYAQNLLFYRPDAIDQFVCPICLKSFDRTQLNKNEPDVILAHVIPKSNYGKLTTLSCRTCDNHIGTAYNVHVLEEEKFHNFEMGLIEKPVDISYGGGKLPGYIKLSKDGEPPSISFWSVHPNEPRYPKFIDEMVAHWDDQKVNIEFSAGFVPRKRDASLLHSAFLMMFYCFGYEYILSKNANCVRQIINGNNTSWDLSKLISSVSFDKPFSIRLPAVGILYAPKEICSFIVIVASGKKKGLRSIALPGFAEKGYEAYRHLLSLPEHPIKSQIRFLTNTSLKRLTMKEYIGSSELAWNYYTSMQNV